MYFIGMSDWNLAEQYLEAGRKTNCRDLFIQLADINWDVFGKSDDHIVPHQGDELLDESSTLSDTYKKPQHDVKNDVEKNMHSRGSATKTALWGKEDAYYPPTENGSLTILDRSGTQTASIVVPTLCDVESTANDTVFPSQDDRFLDYCVNEYTDANSNNMFCSKDPSLGTRVSTHDKSCLSSFNGVSPDVSDLSFLESEQKDMDADLAYYDWPDIGNFEDIDKMFRNWDGQTGTVDELSWFSSSSNTIYGSEIAFEPGFQSSSSDLVALHAKLETHCPNANFCAKTVPADHDKPTSSKGKSACKEKSCDRGDEINNAGLTQISNEYSLNRSGVYDIKIESQQSSEDKGTKRAIDQMLSDSDVLAPQIYCSQQKHFTGPSSCTHDLDPQLQLGFGLPAHQVPFTQRSSSVEFEKGTNQSSSYEVSNYTVNHPNQCPEKFPDQLYMPQVMASEENIEKLNQRQQLCITVPAEHPYQQTAFRSKTSAQKKLVETRHGSETGDVGLELPTVEMGNLTGQESSVMTSVSFDDITAKVTSFQQLQDVMNQLDARTKMCIRDSMYRLARSATQRHGFSQNFSEGTTDAKGIHCTETSKRSAEFMNVETNTNPIDRSIAHLLFHKPVECATRSNEDTRSLKSRAMNEQFHVPIANPVLIPNQLDHQGTFGGCSDMETLGGCSDMETDLQ